MKSIQIHKSNLPATVEEIHKFILIGREVLKAHKAKIRACDKVGLAYAAKTAALSDTQDIAEALIEAEARLGGMLANIPQKKQSSGGGSLPSLPEGISHKDSHFAQTIAKNRGIADHVTKAARDSGRVATPWDVYDEIKRTEREDAVQSERRDAANVGKNKKIKIDFRLGDFEDVFSDLKDGSVDCIITDPPYPVEFIECWSKLSRFAKRVLKQNGFCIAYSGQMNLPEVIRRMQTDLDYYWTFAVYHEGLTQIVNGVNLICRWKPVLIFQNGKKKLSNTFQDYFVSEQREKAGHDWQQSESGVAYLVEMFTKPGQTVMDPFAGAGTTLLVSQSKGRIPLGAEIDKETYNIARARL